ncbi:related to 54S ribosomal protein L4, mitochondrial [Saccharomycodes ludwigii]|uniref:Large ribosomal subunit protein uL29m n=1 Tax=Saccharomycodes ludwigii TaxID=36035 RepID=A0A376BBP2_9ASCO|nr:related to 54S ribosomal protein L4, mitochondrial [Saccharomycodes ludwigii]
MFATKRGFHTSCINTARTHFTKPKSKPAPRANVRAPTITTHHSNDLKITAPIPPSVSNLSCSDDHPLWQFFSDKKFIRNMDDLDNTSRPWTIAELRRKSFNDLHSLWYTCLKERNILARENHLMKNYFENDRDTYSDASENVRTTMWRIRHVLSERQWSFDIASAEFFKDNTAKAAFIKDFETEFLSNEDIDGSFEMLKRFQYAVFGISEYIDENKVDRLFVDGLKYIANLKLKKFNAGQELEGGEITDAGEAFAIFAAENNEQAVKEVVEVVKNLRSENKSVSRYDELETVQAYIDQLYGTPAETEPKKQ